jgi:hypothetical protein
VSIEKILNAFPKKRPAISDDMQKIYAVEYKKNRDGKSPLSFVAQKLESWMHKKVSKAYPLKKLSSRDTLEIGAGTLNQIFYELKSGNYDFIEPLNFLYKDSPYLSRTRQGFSDISEAHPTSKYGRIISVAVLEHVEDLPQLLKKSIEHMADGGVFACGIPSEGGFLWGVAWRFTTGLEYRLRTGLNYSELMRHEHLNEALEIERLLQYYFKDVKIQRLGLGRHFSLYTYIECRNPKSL